MIALLPLYVPCHIDRVTLVTSLYNAPAMWSTDQWRKYPVDRPPFWILLEYFKARFTVFPDVVRSITWVDNHWKLYSLYWLVIEGCWSIVSGRQGKQSTLDLHFPISELDKLILKLLELILVSERLCDLRMLLTCFQTNNSKYQYQDSFQILLQPSRYNVDKFDERLMKRDEKITGSRFRQKVRNFGAIPFYIHPLTS